MLIIIWILLQLKVAKTQESATVRLARPSNPSRPTPPAGSIPAASEGEKNCSRSLLSTADFHLSIDKSQQVSPNYQYFTCHNQKPYHYNYHIGVFDLIDALQIQHLCPSWHDFYFFNHRFNVKNPTVPLSSSWKSLSNIHVWAHKYFLHVKPQCQLQVVQSCILTDTESCTICTSAHKTR